MGQLTICDVNEAQREQRIRSIHIILGGKYIGGLPSNKSLECPLASGNMKLDKSNPYKPTSWSLIWVKCPLHWRFPAFRERIFLQPWCFSILSTGFSVRSTSAANIGGWRLLVTQQMPGWCYDSRVLLVNFVEPSVDAIRPLLVSDPINSTSQHMVCRAAVTQARTRPCCSTKLLSPYTPNMCSGRLVALSSPVSSQCIFLPLLSCLLSLFLCHFFHYFNKFPPVPLFFHFCTLPHPPTPNPLCLY